jgi:isopentenyl phosphate kinase
VNKDLIIIKLGGSVITRKESSKPVFRKRVVKRLCREIYDAKKKLKFNLILIHGAGSFGHPYAKKFSLNKGYLNSESAIGIALTKRAVLELNFLIVRELVNIGINAVFVEPSAIVETSKNKIKKFDTRFIKSLLSVGVVPILSGDVVFDDIKGIAILSGDQIASYLAKKLKAKKVIFVSDVNGVFDKDPKTHKGARIIRTINNDNYKDIIKQMKTNDSSDVTGEMKGKILAIRNDLLRTKVIIVNGQKRNNVLKALINERSLGFGTVINF